MSASAEAAEGEPNLTPLLDVVLQLIMFFMITVNFVRTEHLPPEIKLPIAQAAIPMGDTSEHYEYLNIDAKGKLVGGREELNTPEKIKAYLVGQREDKERIARARGRKDEVNLLVVIRAHRDAEYQQVWDVLHSCTKAGFKKWQIRVMTGGKESDS